MKLKTKRQKGERTGSPTLPIRFFHVNKTREEEQKRDREKERKQEQRKGERIATGLAYFVRATVKVYHCKSENNYESYFQNLTNTVPVLHQISFCVAQSVSPPRGFDRVCLQP